MKQGDSNSSSGGRTASGKNLFREGAALLLVLLIALAVRLYRLDASGYWQDEVVHLLQSEMLKDVWSHGELASNHLPLFPTVLAGWRLVLPVESEWCMRLLPVLFGLCSLLAVYGCARMMFGSRAALFGAFLLAISPMHVHAARDLKDVTFITLTAMLAAIGMYQAAVRNRIRDWVFYGVAAVLECYNDLFAAPMLLALNLWFLGETFVFTNTGRWVIVKRWFVTNAVAAVLFLPYLRVVFMQAQERLVQAESYLQAPTFWSVVFYLKAATFGYSDRDPLFQAAMIFYAVFACVGLWYGYRHNSQACRLLAFWFILPVGVIYLISVGFRSVFLTRAMMQFTVPLFIWCGFALASVSKGSVRNAGIAGFLLFALIPLLDDFNGRFPLYQWPHRPGVHAPQDYRPAVAAIRERCKPGDVVLHASGRSWFPFYWYGSKDAPQFVVSPDPGLVQHVLAIFPSSVRRPEFQPWFMRPLQPVAAQAKRIWFVATDWEREYLPGSAGQTWRWLDSHFVEQEHTVFGDYDVFLYKRGHDDATEAVRRDKDDGVSAELTFRGSEVPYRKVKPDFGLVPRSEEERRGGLTLSFLDTGLMKSDTDTRGIRFSIENRKDRSVPCKMMSLFSVDVTDLTSLEETHPESGVWRIVAMPVFDAPLSMLDWSVWQFYRSDGGHGELKGEETLSPGTYVPILYCAGITPDTHGLYPFGLEIQGNDVFTEVTCFGGPWFGWSWLKGSPVPHDDGGKPLSLQINPREDAKWAAFAYLAWLPEAVDVGDGASWFHTEEFTLSGHEARTWELRMPDGSRRLDVWLVECREDGQAYRIFMKDLSK
ncbi:MAG TPA: glycosyltransferase family 39 protein [Candidatus Hydrogenedentes bacterium]|nr:glycosyltransferase family 39 protein [Candidatus Hydrogenedentota bacterium]HOL77832.1 glycosyltransferase family 39 protein [Candidatus Hydrogenedentota bacterium]